MNRVSVDTAAPAVKRFLRNLPVTPNGVELELAGEVIGRFLPAKELSDSEKTALLKRGRELVQRARQRNRGVAARVLEREVQKAVAEVRQQRRT